MKSVSDRTKELRRKNPHASASSIKSTLTQEGYSNFDLFNFAVIYSALDDSSRYGSYDSSSYDSSSNSYDSGSSDSGGGGGDW